MKVLRSYEIKEIVEEYQRGDRFLDIQKKWGIPYLRVKKVLVGAGVESRRTGPRQKEIVDGQYRCGRCKQWKPVENYTKYHKAPNGLNYYCKECYAIIRKPQAEKEHKKRLVIKAEQKHTKRLSTLYNMTRAEYDALVEHQQGLCALCGKPETFKGRGGEVKRLSIDHNHSTKKVRGLLCGVCNHALSILEHQDNLTEHIEKIIKYLNRGLA